jgi:hypothetical protein
MTDIQNEIDALSERIKRLETQDKDTELELRFRRMWKTDISAAYRGQIQDILSHVDSKVSELLREPLQKVSDDTRHTVNERLSRNDLSIEERFADLKKHLEHEIAGVAIRLLEEYGVCGRDGKPIKY